MLKNLTTAVDVVTWDDPTALVEGEHVALHNAQASMSDGTAQLTIVDGVTEKQSIQMGVGHTESQTDVDSLIDTAEGATAGGESDDEADNVNTAAAESSGGESTSTERTADEVAATDGSGEEREENAGNGNDIDDIDPETAGLRLKGQLIQHIRKRDKGETLSLPSIAGKLNQPPEAVEQTLSNIATDRSVMMKIDSGYEVL